jgi:uncharacterized protein YdhG (YjbR/CyaY superfamily)
VFGNAAGHLEHTSAAEATKAATKVAAGTAVLQAAEISCFGFLRSSRFAESGSHHNSFQFPLDEPIPYSLFKRIVKLLAKQDSAKAAEKRTGGK